MGDNRVTIDNFTFIKTAIEDLLVIETKVFGDNRGYFMECYQRKAFQGGGIKREFVQDNQSSSAVGVLRGLHFQRHKPQGKLVRVLRGEVYDVAVDLRKGSSTYGKWKGFYLSGENKRMVYIPESFAHGFLVISETAELTYKCTDYYDPLDESGIRYDDPDLGIQWPVNDVESLIISDKDKNLGTFRSYDQVK
jgi:dTDP-4-dehydrorhamnose 3,5-epimerase